MCVNRQWEVYHVVTVHPRAAETRRRYLDRMTTTLSSVTPPALPPTLSAMWILSISISNTKYINTHCLAFTTFIGLLFWLIRTRTFRKVQHTRQHIPGRDSSFNSSFLYKSLLNLTVTKLWYNLSTFADVIAKISSILFGTLPHRIFRQKNFNGAYLLYLRHFPIK